MAASERRALGQRELERAARAVAEIFGTNDVVVVGSQALLVRSDDIDREARYSVEFDIYPAQIERWQRDNPASEASEAINALLGEGSHFHATHGFFVDGVDEKTAKLPPDWMDRHERLEISAGDGRTVTVIAPSATDIVASKLLRGDRKDIDFAAICLRQGLTTQAKVLAVLDRIPVEGSVAAQARALAKQASLRKNTPVRTGDGRRIEELFEMLVRKDRDRSR